MLQQIKMTPTLASSNSVTLFRLDYLMTVVDYDGSVRLTANLRAMAVPAAYMTSYIVTPNSNKLFQLYF